VLTVWHGPVFNMASFPTFVACWAALTYSPRLYQLLTGIPFVNAQMALLASLNKATCVCSGVTALLLKESFILRDIPRWKPRSVPHPANTSWLRFAV
jgi:hypothetical protein